MGAHLLDAVCIWFTDVQAGVTGHAGMKYSHIRDIVVSCCVFLNPLRERQSVETSSQPDKPITLSLCELFTLSPLMTDLCGLAEGWCQLVSMNRVVNT